MLCKLFGLGCGSEGREGVWAVLEVRVRKPERWEMDMNSGSCFGALGPYMCSGVIVSLWVSVFAWELE